jgi:hypothetical protein
VRFFLHFKKCCRIHQGISSKSLQAAGHGPGGGVLGRGKGLILKNLIGIPTGAKIPNFLD